jgi:vancomycin aglycone glucosyltransferase
MKVLLAPVGSRGDVQPQLVLGQELMRRGHQVTVGAPPNFRSWVEGYGFAFVPVGADINAVMMSNRGMTERHPALALPGQLPLVRKHVVQQTRDLFEVTHDADLVVAAGLSLAAKMVADKLRVPYVFCCYSLSAMYSAEHPPAVVPVYGLPKLANRALWLGVTQAFDVSLGGVVNNLRREMGLRPDKRPWLAIHSSNTLLTQDSVMGELPGDVPGQSLQVPALVPRPDAAQPLSDLLDRFLRGAGEGSGGASPVVYLGFGSMPSIDRARVLRIARELFEEHRARVVLYSAHREDEGAELPVGVFATGDTDHQSLISRVDLIVHHGGAGTTAAALRSGVPQLVVPHIVDQFFHGRRVAELGLGPAPVGKAALDTAAIAGALKDRFKYWGAAQRVRASLKREGGAAAAADYLEHLGGRDGV